MPIVGTIVDAASKRAADVTAAGELVVGPVACNIASAAELAIAATGYNLAAPLAGCEIILDGFIINADKGVSATNGADIELYEADSDSETTVAKQIVKVNVVKLDTLAVTGLNICVSSGKWINAKTDDNTVNVTIMYYYKKAA